MTSPINDKHARLAGIAGIVFSVLSLIVIPMAPELGPPLGSSADEIAGWYTRHHTGFLVGNWLGIAAFLPGFIQLSIVAKWIRKRDEEDGILSSLFLTTGTFGFTFGAVVLFVFQVCPFLIEGEGRLGIHAMGNLANVGFALFLLAAMPFLAVTGWASLKTQVFPSWFARASLALAGVAIFVSLGALTTMPRWLAGGGLVTGFGFMSFFIWTLVMSILALRSRAPR